MPGSTALQLYSYPTTGDQASPAGIQTVATQIEKQVVAVFADTATRDSRWTSATGLANGAICFITATGELQLRSNAAWVVIGGRANPFAAAHGVGTYSLAATGSATVAVTFPTGRFSQAPVAIANGQSAGAGSYQITFRCFNITTTGMSVACTMYNNVSVTITAENFAWHASQATSAAAAG